MPKVIYAQSAIKDLEDIYDYSIDRWGVASAMRYKDLIKRAENQIAQNPYQIISRSLLNYPANYRSLNLTLVSQADFAVKVKHPRHVIYYRIINIDTVEIIRILHHRMDVNSGLVKRTNLS
ncbi:MAG: type II toxin-antitoxin system RelE/ParE family toxin [Candidatus Symbiobacter sp.]|nr:type II toxin-antitoxin system RelE/ParE family toxin [Candidatus Symbiobacter sp.]